MITRLQVAADLAVELADLFITEQAARLVDSLEQELVGSSSRLGAIPASRI